ncbi:PQQ-binding-like beta-propeller repeat protein [Streptomyces populi]
MPTDSSDPIAMLLYPLGYTLWYAPRVLGVGAGIAFLVALVLAPLAVLGLLRARNGHRRRTAWPLRGTRLDALVWTMIPTAVLGAFALPDLLSLRDRRWSVFGAVGTPVLVPALALLLALLGLLLWLRLPASSRSGRDKERYRPVTVQEGAGQYHVPWSGAAAGAARGEPGPVTEALLPPPSRQWPREPAGVTVARRARAGSVTVLTRITLFPALVLALVAALAAPADPRVGWYAMGEVVSVFVSDDVAYVLYGEEAGDEDRASLSALNAVTGEELWRVPLPTRAVPGAGGPGRTRSGGKGQEKSVYAGGLSVNALRTGDGSVRWTYPAAAKAPKLLFGTPTVAGGTVLVTATDGTLRALDGRTGKLRWQKRWGVTEDHDDASFSYDQLPDFRVVDGRVYVAGVNAVNVYDIASGGHHSVIRVPGEKDENDSVRVAASGHRVYVASARTLAAYQGRGAARVWSTPLGDAYSAQGLTVSGDSLFLVNGQVERFSTRTGKPAWSAEVSSRTAPVVVGDRVLLAYDQKITCLRRSSGASCGTMSVAGDDETFAVPGDSFMVMERGDFVETFSSDLSPRDGWNARQMLRGWGATI